MAAAFASEMASQTDIIDSGAARHVHRHTQIQDAEDKCKLTSFTGEDRWTEGAGYVHMELHDDLTGQHFPLDIANTDYMSDAPSDLLSMCKLIRAGWRFELELGSLYGYTPNGQRVSLLMNSDDVLRMPRTIREDKAELPIPDPSVTINVAQTTHEGVSSDFLHRLFNHSNPEKVHQTLGVTTGIKQPACQMKGCKCTACATANARRRGLKHTQFSMVCMATVSTDMPGLDSVESAQDDEDDYEDYECDGCPSLMSETESDDDTESDSEDDNPINNITQVHSESDWKTLKSLLEEARSTTGHITASATKAENSDSDEYDTAEPDSVDPDPKLKYKADTPGKTAISKPPRFDVPGLKPFEVMFCDEKDYPTTQRGGWTTSFILLDLASDAWF